ncbi:GGDEF domain-containing protein [Nocardiopsis flavescens]|uniref:Diguanylate cyclase (GGDEF) domain-containing protein n=1 Tax=Nocardiopsis flavescens TaxID=758803 RepID=A0A1M6IT22_9ACTN|nr:GGDEF domain-containing protein [Nocardiopsis flavescens]SHJ37630.1 diguanylate cyclase (GGDEF) domain-containing protein [Nocardiopsis flavescens]
MSISERSAASVDRPAGGRARWPFLQEPPGLIVYMSLLVLAALFLFGVAFALTAFSPVDLAVFATLVAGAAISVEANRRLATPQHAGLNRDLLGAWWFPVVLLLPPVYSFLIPVPVYLLVQRRLRQTLVYRRVFNTASVGVSGFVVSVAWHWMIAGDFMGGLRGDAGVTEQLTSVPGVLFALAGCAVFTVLNTLIVALAARISTGTKSGLLPLWDREALMVDTVELCVGVIVAALAHISLFLLPIVVPPILLLQRSLLYQQLQTAARTDPKTGLLNAPTWEQEASIEIARSRAARNRSAVLIIDIDHFKRVNDTHGHLFGDQVLMGVATTISHQLRQSDLLGRFGGEEFVVLLPGADVNEAWHAAERLRVEVGCMEIAVEKVQVTVTVSVGLAVAGEHGNDLVELLTAADLALYRAKETGRNRVCLPGGRPEGGTVPDPRETTAAPERPQGIADA